MSDEPTDPLLKGDSALDNKSNARWSVPFRAFIARTSPSIWPQLQGFGIQDVSTTIKKIGANTTCLQPTRKPWYTIPAIVDDAVGVALPESAEIAEYLDTSRIIPEGTHTLQAALCDAFRPKQADHRLFLVPITMLVSSAAFFRSKYKAIFGNA
ncbi:hypothetical protein F5877DRAFT_76576 [Lentinula edodes]|nr:hypothetical protein F5877DRAFT_76576 [Lentinula edodes]